MIKRREQKEKGQALVEFAVILPVLLMVLWGIFQFGIAFNDYIQVTSAAREGARKAAVSRSLGGGAQLRPPSPLRKAWPLICISARRRSRSLPPTTGRGNRCDVTVKYRYKINIIGRVVATGTSHPPPTMRIE